MLSDDRQLIETPVSEETVFRGALIDVSHMQVRLPNGPIKTIGDTTVSVALHTDVVVDVTVSVYGEAA